MVKITGSCLCGQVSYQITGAVHMINHCHCSQCRKAHGAAFGSFLHADADGFQWLSGMHLVNSYQVPDNDDRCFCSNCGSNVPVIEKEDNNVIVPAGTLDTDPGIRPIMQIFVGSKALWYEIADSTPQFEEFPPEGWLENELLKQDA